jgi:hypothetical protein
MARSSTACILILALGGCQAAANIPTTPVQAIGAVQGAMIEAHADSVTENADMLAAAYAEAQAAAPRPGDESLSCDAMQAEIDAALSDPEYLASQAAIAESAEELAGVARRGMAQGAVGAVGMAALGVSTAGSPGQGAAVALASFASTTIALAQARAAEAGPAADMRAELLSIMEPMARLEHVATLADERECAFMSEQPG